MILVFVSMGGQGKVLFGDSLVYSKGHILGCPKLGDPKAPFHPPAAMELNWEEKIKISLGLPPSAAEFYPLNFNFTSGIPWEIPGGSLQQGWLGQHSHGEPKPEVNPKG